MASFTLACPNCKSVLVVPAKVPAGQKVKCPKCATVFAVPGDDDQFTSRTKRSNQPPPIQSRFGEGRAEPIEDDEDYDVDTPRRVRRSTHRVTADEDDDFIEDRPRRSFSRSRQGQNNQVLLIGVIVGVAAVIVLTGVGIAAGIWFRSSRAASQQTLAAQQGAREQDVARAPAGAGPNVANPLPAAPQQVDPPNPPAIGDAPRQRQEPPPVPIMPPQFLGQPPPSFDISKRYRENEIITINIQGIPDERSRKYILERLPALIGTRYLMSSRVSGDVTVVVLAPVNNPEAFARKIDFGTVSSVKGRIIKVTAKKLDIPSADADVITQALFDLKSPNLFTRKAALDRLAIADADNRRDEVLKAVQALLSDSDVFTRQKAIGVYAKWGGKDSVPTLLKLLRHPDPHTRRATMEALANLKDERAVEPIAERLTEGLDRHDASKALQALGSTAELTVLKYLGSPDFPTRLEACKILKVIGTKASVRPLQAVALNRNDFVVAQAAQEALIAISTRP